MTTLLGPHHSTTSASLMGRFVMLWAYFNFSQFLLTYAANLIEEIPYMITRISHGWQYLAVFLIVFHFAVPWLLLLSRRNKRTPERLVVIAGWILFMRYADIFMLVSRVPATGENMHLLNRAHSHSCPLAIGGALRSAARFGVYTAGQRRAVVCDPYCAMSIGGEGTTDAHLRSVAHWRPPPSTARPPAPFTTTPTRTFIIAKLFWLLLRRSSRRRDVGCFRVRGAAP